MNITTPLQGTTTVVNQLDENIKVAVENIVNIDEKSFSNKQNDPLTEFKRILFNTIKQNIQGNVNWKIG